jgi:hypothetical protein
MDQVKLRRLRLKKAQAASTQSPAPVPDKPKLPVVPLKPAQLKVAAPLPPPGGQPPTPAEAEPEREGKVLEQLFTMSLRRNENVKPAEDVGMKLVQAIAEAVSQAKPVSELDSTMLPHLGEMSSKIHLMLNALNYHTMFERIKLHALVRWTLEKSLWQDLMNNQLSPVEKLALLQLSIKEMDKAESRITDAKDDLDSSGRGTMADIQSTAERVDRSVAKEDNTALKELEGTSAVGREIARRLLDKASKVLDKRVKEAISDAPRGSSK